MIKKPLITFDAYSQKGGIEEVRFLCEELLAEQGPIQVVNSMFYRLPFRLRVGARAVFDVNGVIPARIVVINSVDVPIAEVEGRVPKITHPELASDVLITLNPVTLDDNAKASIVTALNDPDYTKAAAGIHPLNIHPEDPLKALNSLIVSYKVLCGKEVQSDRVRRVLRKDIFGAPMYKLHMFKHRHDAIDYNKIEEGIEGARPNSTIPFDGVGSMHDIDVDMIAKVRKRLNHGTEYVFYSMAIQAEDYMRQTDFMNALLYSVIAFENAHAEFVEHVAETKAGCSKARKWAQNLIREAGVSAMIRLTPYLFMDAENRPSDTTVKSVIRAIQIRNELAHAKRDNQRNLKIDSYKSNDLIPLVEAVFNYINAIARQLPD